MTRYKKVHINGQTLHVAESLSSRTNAARGYCDTCSGNGTVADGRNKVKPCGDCNGTGRP